MGAFVTDIVDDAEIPASGETIRNQSKNLFAFASIQSQ
jgi:hypothetical protein